jgi:hypothetical protein
MFYVWAGERKSVRNRSRVITAEKLKLMGKYLRRRIQN